MSDGSAIDPFNVEPRALSQGLADPRLLLWLSPAFPVGAFAYSHGLERAAEAGWIKDRASLEAWLSDLLTLGALRNDLILVAAALRAWPEGSRRVAEVNELALALQPSAERHLETTTQGNAFLVQIRAAWPCPAVETCLLAKDGDAAYPVAVGLAAAGHGIGLAPTLEAFALAGLGNLVSAALRLGVVGQTDGQRVLAALLASALDAACKESSSSLADLGGAVWRSDIGSLQHETQYTRLFRS